MEKEKIAQTMIRINQMAMNEIRNRKYERAIEYFTQSLVLEEKLGMKAQMAESFFNLASTYYLMQDFEAALQKAKFAKTLFHMMDRPEDEQKVQDMIEQIQKDMQSSPPKTD